MTLTLPRFSAEPSPPLELPSGRRLGPVVGLAEAPDGHIWVLHITSNPAYLPPELRENPAILLPPVVEFDAQGAFVQAWGGPDHLPRLDGAPQWPRQEETISIDADGALWVFGADVAYDHAVQRFAPDGTLLLRIGHFGSVGSDESPDRLGCPTDAWHDAVRREVYITDGYVNHRVAVFDADTGAFLRAWGAYGRTPPVAVSGRESFNNPVHAISLGPDGYLYICDRKNDRVQVFDSVGRNEPRFIRELELDVESPFGATFNVAFTPGGEFMFIADGSNSRVWVVDREAWKIVDSFQGPNSEGVGLEATIHKIMTDRAGNLWLGRTSRGVEKLRYLGLRPAA
jgi:DNA-binding beta-propeller fold protein YncE